MKDYGTLHELNGRYILKFERFFSVIPEDVYSILTSPEQFMQWYPFATGEMEIKIGGQIAFNDGEGTTYTATITELEKPYLFSFREVDDLINISLEEENQGCKMNFTHTFDDASWAVNTAAGWHRCLDVFSQIVNGEATNWQDNAAELRELYSKAFS